MKTEKGKKMDIWIILHIVPEIMDMDRCKIPIKGDNIPLYIYVTEEKLLQTLFKLKEEHPDREYVVFKAIGFASKIDVDGNDKIILEDIENFVI